MKSDFRDTVRKMMGLDPTADDAAIFSAIVDQGYRSEVEFEDALDELGESKAANDVLRQDLQSAEKTRASLFGACIALAEKLRVARLAAHVEGVAIGGKLLPVSEIEKGFADAEALGDFLEARPDAMQLLATEPEKGAHPGKLARLYALKLEADLRKTIADLHAETDRADRAEQTIREIRETVAA